jgi:hypothetical protein
VPQINDASQLNTYDQLNRLISTQHGPVTLAPSGQASIDPVAIIREERWSLDLLGNWSGSGGGAGTTGPPGLERTGNLDQHGTLWARLTANSNADFERITHAVDRRNAITGIASERGTIGGAPAAHNTATVYDGAGNIVFDGELVYIYDAWARITEIRRGTLNASVPSPDPAADQPPNPYARVNVGELVKSHAYDGLGRLVTTTTPLPAAPGIAKRARTERFIYDGVRRVQEYVSESPQTPNASPTNRLEREYVWGPGDGIAGVDELLAQYDGAGRAWWVVQDGGGDIVALAASADPQHPYARVAAQWQYDAYGTVTAADHFIAHPPMHAGHKGLFLDRIDANSTGTTHDGDPIPDGFGGYTTTGTDPPRLAPYARTLYHVRNRNYAPHLGRWLQLDPNASGRDVLEASVYAGRGFHAASMAFGLEEMYGDGGSLFAYLGGNTWGRFDAGGLHYALEIGSIASDVVEAVAEQYGINMDTDFEWALDWNQRDDAYTRLSNDWIVLSMSNAAHRNSVNAMLGPLTFVKDAFDFGTEIGQYLFGGNDSGFEEWIEDEDSGVGPVVGSTGGGIVQELSNSISKHGKRLHQSLIKKLMRRASGFGHTMSGMRVNKQLIDPETRAVLSKKRPDLFAYSVGPPKKVFIGEAVVTTSPEEAVERLRQFAKLYKDRGYEVVTLPPEVP